MTDYTSVRACGQLETAMFTYRSSDFWDFLSSKSFLPDQEVMQVDVVINLAVCDCTVIKIEVFVTV